MIREVPFGSRLYEQAVALREAQLRLPLGLRITARDVAGEDRQRHVVALDGEVVVGTLVLATIAPTIVKARQMAVAPVARGKGLGSDILRHAEALVRSRGATEVRLNARLTAIGFYEKSAYVAVGEIFTEIGLPHVAMVKRL